MSRFGELCTMENEMKIHSQLDETKLKLDSSSLYYEVGPTRPALAQRVSERSLHHVPAKLPMLRYAICVTKTNGRDCLCVTVSIKK